MFDSATPARGRYVAVIVTHDRPALLGLCLAAVLGQQRCPDLVIVVDNASGLATRTLLTQYGTVRVLRLPENIGGAGGFRAGIELALEHDADWVWLMDDDGRPCETSCLGSLIDTAAMCHADLVGALVVDVDEPDRLSFPIRIAGRTHFRVAEVLACGPVSGFAHLFNGALISAALFHRIGLPDPRFFIRGDEVEFLFRARRDGACIALDRQARFLHPGSHAEIHPIFGGLFYAVVPRDHAKQYYLFRNRSYIFRHYGMWGWLAANVIRYGYYYLVSRRLDVSGLGRWVAATSAGWTGEFMTSRTVADEPVASSYSQP